MGSLWRRLLIGDWQTDIRERTTAQSFVLLDACRTIETRGDIFCYACTEPFLDRNGGLRELPTIGFHSNIWGCIYIEDGRKILVLEYGQWSKAWEKAVRSRGTMKIPEARFVTNLAEANGYETGRLLPPTLSADMVRALLESFDNLKNGTEKSWTNCVGHFMRRAGIT